MPEQIIPENHVQYTKISTDDTPAKTQATTSATPWSIQESVDLYGIDLWGNGYFRVNEAGHVVVTPEGSEEKGVVDLYELTQDLLDRGFRVPIMIRFPDIIKARVELINQCFDNAIREHTYKGRYSGVYPVKVNQQRHLVEELVKTRS